MRLNLSKSNGWLSLNTGAYSGSGGSTGTGTAGQSGNALATMFGKNTGAGGSSVSAYSQAQEWWWGVESGDATAMATAISSAESNAVSSAYGLNALATSSAQGTNGWSSATAHGTSFDSEFSIWTQADASVGSTSDTEAWSSGDGILRDSTFSVGKEAFAYMFANGLDSDYNNFVAGNSNTTAAFQNAEWLGAGLIGGGFPGDGIPGVEHAGSISTTFNFYGWDGRHDGKYLMLSLLDGQASGFGGVNDTWSLSVYSGGSDYSNAWDSSTLSFTDLFNGKVINLGVYDNWKFGWSSSIDVTFTWATSVATTSFSGKLAAGFSAIPESSLALLVTLAAGLALAARRRRR